MLKRLLLVLVPVVVLQAPAHSASFVFGLPIHMGTSNANAVAVADFNGDGRDDLAAVFDGNGGNELMAGFDGHLEVSLQRSDGSLAPALRLDVPSTYVHAVVEANLGGDGTREILVGHDGGLAVYRWNGVGGFTRNDHPAAYECWDITIADLDADGGDDVLCLGKNADAMLYYSDPATALTAPSYMQTAAMGAAAVGQAQLKDVTGDDKPDLLLASSAANSFFVYPNDGHRGFLPAVAYPYPENYLWSGTIEVMDPERDGVNEVIVTAPCNLPCAALYVYRRGAQGYFELSKRVPTLDNPGALLATDVDRDGYQDLLVGHSGWHTVGRYMGQEQRLSTAELWSSVQTHHGSHRLAVGDLDHDGQVDLAVANFFGVSVLYGGRPAASDFNSDFVSDLVWRSSTGENMVWNSADSTAPHSFPVRDPNWSSQAIGDFDGDGLADLFWRDRTTGANEVWSAGESPLTPITGVPGQDWQVVGAGDFDGDDRSDLLWRNSRTGANVIWKSGSAATKQATAGVTDQRWKVAGVGDFDGDGRSDILWRHSASGSNAIWRSGRRDIPQAVTTVRSAQWTVAGIGDFDGDGKDDVAWRNASTGVNTIWRSANSATPMAVTRVSDLAWTIAAVADYNGDGRADLMWRNTGSGSNVIWRSADARQTQAVTAILGWNVLR